MLTSLWSASVGDNGMHATSSSRLQVLQHIGGLTIGMVLAVSLSVCISLYVLE